MGVLPYVQKVLCSEGSMFRKYLFRRFYVQKVLYSEGPMFKRSYVQKVLYLEGSMFRRSYVQKNCVQKVLYSEGSMIRRSYIQICSEDLYSENPLFYFGTNLLVGIKLQCKIINHSISF